MNSRSKRLGTREGERAGPHVAWCGPVLSLPWSDGPLFSLQLLQQATSSSNLGAFSGIQQMAGKS